VATPRAIFFDLDDTLISAYRAQPAKDLWRTVFLERSGQIPGADIDDLVSRVVATADSYWAAPDNDGDRWPTMGEIRRTFVLDALSTIGLRDQDFAIECADAFTASREQGMTLFEGAEETLQTLQSQKVSLTLITNGASLSQRWKINRFDLAQYFDHIQIEEEAGVGKPHQDAYQKALARIDYAAEDVWMIGDHLENDVSGSQKLGLTGVWFNGHNLERNNEVSPHHEVNSHAELQQLLFNQ